MRLLPLILLAILTQSLGDVLLSRGMKEIPGAVAPHLDASRYGMVALTVASNPYFVCGLLLLIAAFFLFLTLLSRADLSYVLPITSFSYVLIALLAVYLLDEKISAARWFGIFLICGGVLLVGKGESATANRRSASDQPERQN